MRLRRGLEGVENLEDIPLYEEDSDEVEVRFPIRGVITGEGAARDGVDGKRLVGVDIELVELMVRWREAKVVLYNEPEVVRAECVDSELGGRGRLEPKN